MGLIGYRITRDRTVVLERNRYIVISYSLNSFFFIRVINVMMFERFFFFFFFNFLEFLIPLYFTSATNCPSDCIILYRTTRSFPGNEL